MKLEKRSFLRGGGRLSFAVATLMGVTLCAFTVKAEKYYWTAAEGNFNDATKWHKTTYNGATGEVPGVSDEANLYGTNCTIRVDDEIEVGMLWTNYGATGKTNVYTLVGNGKLRLGVAGSGETSLQVVSRSMLVMDGPDIYMQGGVQYCEGGTFVIKRGTYTPAGHYLKAAPGRIVIDGGKVTSFDETSNKHVTSRWISMQNAWDMTGNLPPLCFIDLKGGLLEARCSFNVGTFTMTGGTWDRTKVSQSDGIHNFSTNLILNIQGGERIACSPNETPRNDTNFFNVAELEGGFPGSKWLPISADGKYKFGSIVTPMVFVVSNNVELTGNTLDVSSYQLATGACDVVMNVGTLRSDATTVLTAYSAHRPIHLYSPKLVRFEAHGAGTMRILSIANADTIWRFGKGVDISTTADDGGAVTFRLGNACFDAGATVDFAGIGDGVLYFTSFRDAIGNSNGRSGFSNQLARVSFAGGGRLTLENWSYNANGYPLQTERFVLGTGSKLKTTFATYAHFDANEVELDASNELILSLPESGDANYFPPAPLTIGPKHLNDFQTVETQPTITFVTAGAETDWEAKWINGQPVVWRKNVSQRAVCNITRTKLSKWRGTVDGDWSNSANWLIDTGKEQAEDPLEQAIVFDGGYTNTRITVDSEVKAYQIYVLDKTAPVAFVGNGSIVLGYTGRDNVAMTSYGGSSAIGTISVNPLVFDVPVSLSSTITANRYFTINQNSRAYIGFMKALDGGDVFTIKGDVRIGGTATAKNILFNEQASGLPAKRTRLSVIPGGSFTATRQTWLQSAANVEIHVCSNATFTVQNPSGYTCFWGSSYERRPIWVKEFGKFDCRAPLGGSTKVSFKGKGEVRLADTGSQATADYPVELEDVTFAIDSFTAGHPIVLKGSPTWASKVDWTYALDPIALPAGETLAVDTGDLDTGVGHSVAINSALSADKLVKKGAGTLALGSNANAIGKVSVDEGTLSIAASQTFNSLAVAPGAGLDIASGATVALSESIDLTDVTVATAVGKYWTTLLTVPEGCSINGAQTDNTQPFMMRVVEAGNGLALQMRRRPGMTMSFR